MPATSRSGECLARRSSSGRDGSPSKSTMTKSCCVEQHLAQVIVAVIARLRRRRSRRARCARACATQRVAAREQALRASARTASGSAATRLAQRASSVCLGLVRELLAQRGDVRARERLGIERGVAGGFASARVQLGGAPAERADAARGSRCAATSASRVDGRAAARPPAAAPPRASPAARARRRRRAAGARSCSPSRCPRSATYCCSTAMRRRLAVRVDVLERAEQRRDVREGRDLGQEAADLDLGIDAARAGADSPSGRAGRRGRRACCSARTRDA